MQNSNQAINAALRQKVMQRRMPATPGQDMQAPPASVPAVAPPPIPSPNDPGFTLQPPGVRAKEDLYSYEKLPDNTWREYPPGQPAPPTGWTASMNKPASVMDLERIQAERETLENMLKTRQQKASPRPAEPYRDMMR